MDRLVNFGKALADPTRVRILNLLRQHELCVCEIVDALELSGSTLSTHLQTLRTAEIVKTEKRSSWIIYSIRPSARVAIDAAFQHFDIHHDRCDRDQVRLQRRIHLRVDGCCVLGAGQLEIDDASA